MANWVSENPSPGFSGIFEGEKLFTVTRSKSVSPEYHYVNKACQ